MKRCSNKVPCRIQTSNRDEGWDIINWFNSVTLLRLSQVRIWISNVICCRRSIFVFNMLRWQMMVGFVNIGGIVGHHCLFLLMNNTYYIA